MGNRRHRETVRTNLYFLVCPTRTDIRVLLITKCVGGKDPAQTEWLQQRHHLKVLRTLMGAGLGGIRRRPAQPRLTELSPPSVATFALIPQK